MSALVRAVENLVYIDQLSLRWAASRRSPLLDRLMRGLTRAGNWRSWTLLIISAWLAGGTYRSLALLVTPRLLLTLGICYAIKALSKRPRPNQALRDFASLMKNPDPYSFPSSHAACVWVVCVSLGLALGAGWPFFVAYALAMSYSRVHVGAHYPLDVMIGAALGCLLAVI